MTVVRMTFLERCPGNVTWPNSFLEMAVGTSAIVRLEEWNRMVTKGYQKGVYKWVTLGISGGTGSLQGLP